MKVVILVVAPEKWRVKRGKNKKKNEETGF